MVQRVEVTAIKRITDLRTKSFASRRGQVDNASQGISAIKHAVRAAQNFCPVNAGGKNIPKIHCAANFSHRNTIQPDSVGVAIATADENGFSDSALASLKHLQSRNLPQWLQCRQLELKLICCDYGD